MDHVLGHLRLDFRNVFGVAGAGLLAALQRTAAMRAAIGAMLACRSIRSGAAAATLDVPAWRPGRRLRDLPGGFW